MRKLGLALILLLFADYTEVSAAEVSLVYKGKMFVRPQQYEYAPTAIVRNGNIECWFCAGETIPHPLDPWDAEYNDHIHRAAGPYSLGNPTVFPWYESSLVLCPSSPGPNGKPRVDLCPSDYPSGPDKVHACDPSVVRVGGTYYMYYTAGTYDANNKAANAIFLATSGNGIDWVKHPAVWTSPPTPPSAAPQALITAPNNDRYGAGQQSVVYKDGTYYMYYYRQDWYAWSWVYLLTSTDPKSFANQPGTPIYNPSDPSEFPIPAGAAAPDIKYIPGWDAWFMISNEQADGSQADKMFWNISRDGIHWLPWNWKRSDRTVNTGTGVPAHNPGLVGSELGHIGDGGIGPQVFDVLFGDGNPFTLNSDIGAASLTLSPQPLTGWADGVTSDKIVYGWAYDPDTGTNDDGANGGVSRPLGHETHVAVWANGQPRGSWIPADKVRCDVRDAGIAPDCYHGFSIDLKTILGPGTYTIQVEGGEFPSGGGGRMLGGTHTVTIP